MIEGAEYSKYMIRSIIQAYYKHYSEDGDFSDVKINYLDNSSKNSENEDSAATEPTNETDPA